MSRRIAAAVAIPPVSFVRRPHSNQGRRWHRWPQVFFARNSDFDRMDGAQMQSYSSSGVAAMDDSDWLRAGRIRSGEAEKGNREPGPVAVLFSSAAIPPRHIFVAGLAKVLVQMIGRAGERQRWVYTRTAQSGAADYRWERSAVG
jgi:hypothetical protein